MKGYLESLNPTYKALTIIICAVILAFSYSIAFNLIVFIVSMLLLLFASKVSKLKILKAILPVTIVAFSLMMTGLLYTGGESVAYTTSFGSGSMPIKSLLNGIQLATRVFSFLGLGMLFSMTTNPKEFVDSLMHQAKLPPKFAYGVMASLHLLPRLKDEYEQAKLALAARGTYVGMFSTKPVFAMLVNCIRWSELLAMAMTSKGFDEEAGRSYYNIPTVVVRDYIFMIGMITLHLFANSYL